MIMNKIPKTIIISILALAAVIAVSLVFYNEQLTNREKSILDAQGIPIEWIKYENKELGFSFEYPKGFVVEERDVNKLFPIGDLLEERFKTLALSTVNNEEGQWLLIIRVLENPEGLSPKDWRKAYDGGDVDLIYKKNVYYNANQFFLEFLPDKHPWFSSAIMTSENKSFSFLRGFEPYDSALPQEQKLMIEKSLDHILETFKVF